MGFFDQFRKQNKETANVAKDRLQIIVAHARAEREQPDYLPKMQHEIMQVIRKYVDVSQDKVKVQVDKNEDCSVLELNIVLDK